MHLSLPKGYTPNILNDNRIIKAPPELVEANEKLKAKRKLALILKSKLISEHSVSLGDIVDVYIKRD